MEQRVCLECKQPLTGRADKKFCDDQCRSTYNNRMNSNKSGLMRQINSILRKNRQVLAESCPEGKSKIKKEKIISKGFNTKYHTHIYTTREGSVYHYCYDYGWLQLDNDFILIVRNE